jgi:hypothetical protein
MTEDEVSEIAAEVRSEKRERLIRARLEATERKKAREDAAALEAAK